MIPIRGNAESPNGSFREHVIMENNMNAESRSDSQYARPLRFNTHYEMQTSTILQKMRFYLKQTLMLILNAVFGLLSLASIAMIIGIIVVSFKAPEQPEFLSPISLVCCVEHDTDDKVLLQNMMQIILFTSSNDAFFLR
ncbi:unnamed protein product [Rotaria socialis]